VYDAKAIIVNDNDEEGDPSSLVCVDGDFCLNFQYNEEICGISVCFFLRRHDTILVLRDKGDGMMSKLKKDYKKFGLLGLSIAMLFSLSATYAAADVSRVVYFSIQNNAGCNTTSNMYSIMFNISNTGLSTANVTLQLYNSAGTEITITGSSVDGYMSNITPGTPFTLDSKETEHYHVNFGYTSSNACSDRPAFGKITVNNEAGLLVASGETRSLNRLSTPVLFAGAPIIINAGQPF